MTRSGDDLAIVEKTVVVFDICSSTAILEDLILTNSVSHWRDLLIEVKDFIRTGVAASGVELYKFLGDGWLLLFDSHMPGPAIVDFLDELSSFYEQVFEREVMPHLQGVPPILGLTFGVDRGPLVRVEMMERSEYVGRAINVAARLQDAAKNCTGNPAYQVLFSKPAFTRLAVPNRWQTDTEPQRLRNIRGNENCQCVRLYLRGTAKTPGSSGRQYVEPISVDLQAVTPQLDGYSLNENFSRAELQALLGAFRRAAKRQTDTSLAERLEADLLGPSVRLRRDTVRQLAKWCDTRGTVYQDGMQVARRISQLLFGQIVSRARLGV